MNKRLCMECNVPMKKTNVIHKGMKFEARQCPKCKEKIFTEDLAMKAISQLEARRLQKEYIKHPIKIGHSWGMTFPKDITDVFSIDNPKTTLKIYPNIEKGKIELDIK